jgi:hypothetical protein
MHKRLVYYEFEKRKSGRLSVVDTRELDSAVVSLYPCSSLTFDWVLYVCILEPQGSLVSGGWVSNAS